MNPEPDLIEAANRSFVDSLKLLAEYVPGAETRRFGGVFAVATHLPAATFNGCIVVNPTRPEELEDAVAWVRTREVPFAVWIDETSAPDASAGAVRAGLKRRDAPYPAMALRPIPEAPSPPEGVAVRTVDEVGISTYYAVQEAAGMTPEMARRFIPATFADDPRVQIHVSIVDGEPAGNAIAIRSEHVLGVYAVGTVPAARKRGAGRSATWACLEAGRAWGCTVAVLQSSAMAMEMYGRMGFELVVPYAVYVPQAPASS